MCGDIMRFKNYRTLHSPVSQIGKCKDKKYIPLNYFILTFWGSIWPVYGTYFYC